ncbi:hypothetical protein DPMN_193338 [Dreissena polymorpha]|uniref:Uncharacterized protein n=1 Tax=Dreissena polymorpha TaxID=45954 RepID=A0A9D3Y4M8_DREPO|nr:hypothetical protein DPMN_193338 [Dreissena polymorpha]
MQPVNFHQIRQEPKINVYTKIEHLGPNNMINLTNASVTNNPVAGRCVQSPDIGKTGHVGAVRRVTKVKTSVTNRHRSPSDQRSTFFPLIGLAPADDRTHIGSFCSIGRSPD